MSSQFDKLFASIANAHHSVFGVVATYVVAADPDGDAVELRFLIDGEQKADSHRGASRADVWVLTGSILKTDVAEPAKGDTIAIEGGDRIYRLTQTPTASNDGIQWDCEFQHDAITSRGGNETFPLT